MRHRQEEPKPRQVPLVDRVHAAVSTGAQIAGILQSAYAAGKVVAPYVRAAAIAMA